VDGRPQAKRRVVPVLLGAGWFLSPLPGGEVDREIQTRFESEGNVTDRRSSNEWGQRRMLKGAGDEDMERVEAF
jgi:hypothetical protein